jgi:hypothetical protein
MRMLMESTVTASNKNYDGTRCEISDIILSGLERKSPGYGGNGESVSSTGIEVIIWCHHPSSSRSMEHAPRTLMVLRAAAVAAGRSLFRILGVDHHRWLFSLMDENASIILEEKARRLDETTRRLVSAEDDRTHFGDIDLEDRGLQTVVRSFTIDRILFIRQCLQDSSPGLVADLGDTNGIFLRSMGEGGISVNISEKAVTILHGRGLDAIRADIEHLPFRDNSLAVLFLFETLEHVPNPILMLHEAARVTSGSLILSVPHVTSTTIHPRLYDPTKPVHQHHIFEFSPDDLHRVATHTPFTIERSRIATVIEGRTLLGRIVIPLWRLFERDMFCGCFTHFYLCHLVKRP